MGYLVKSFQKLLYCILQQVIASSCRKFGGKFNVFPLQYKNFSSHTVEGFQLNWRILLICLLSDIVVHLKQLSLLQLYSFTESSNSCCMIHPNTVLSLETTEGSEWTHRKWSLKFSFTPSYFGQCQTIIVIVFRGFNYRLVLLTCFPSTEGLPNPLLCGVNNPLFRLSSAGCMTCGRQFKVKVNLCSYSIIWRPYLAECQLKTEAHDGIVICFPHELFLREMLIHW